MFTSGQTPIHVPLHQFPIARTTAPEVKKAGQAFGNALRCWNCGTQIGEKVGLTFLVASNKVEVGGIPLDPLVWRRCRGGKNNPACRAVNTLPSEWLVRKELIN